MRPRVVEELFYEERGQKPVKERDTAGGRWRVRGRREGRAGWKEWTTNSRETQNERWKDSLGTGWGKGRGWWSKQQVRKIPDSGAGEQARLILKQARCTGSCSWMSTAPGVDLTCIWPSCPFEVFIYSTNDFLIKCLLYARHCAKTRETISLSLPSTDLPS